LAGGGRLACAVTVPRLPVPGGMVERRIASAALSSPVGRAAAPDCSDARRIRYRPANGLWPGGTSDRYTGPRTHWRAPLSLPGL